MSFNTNLGIASTNNATTTALNDGQSYTGTADLNGYNDVMCQVKADQNFDMFIDFSVDGGSNWDSTLTYKGTANIPEVHRLVKGTRSIRMRIENNSGSNMTFLRGGLFYGHFGPLTAPGTLNVGDDADTLVSRPNDWRLDVARNRWSAITSVHKFGENPAVGTTEEDIWFGGGLYNWLQSAATVRIAAGGNAADDSAGAGAREIQVEGLDSNWDEATELITTNGASASTATSTSFIRVNRAV